MEEELAGRKSVVTILPAQAHRSALPALMSGRVLRLLWSLAAVLLSSCVPNPPPAPVPPVAKVETPRLSPGVAVERSFPTGARDEIALDLKGGFYARVSFETRGHEDLAVQLLDPQGQAISRTAGSDGQLSLITAAAGTYRIVFAQQDPQARGSSYRITLLEARQAQAGDEERVAAGRALSEAKLLECEKKYPEALEKAQVSLDHWSRLQDPGGRFEALYEIGLLHDLSNDKDKSPALIWYKQALGAAKDAEDRYGAAKAQTAMGIALLNGSPEEASKDLEAVVPVLRELNDSHVLAEVLFRLGFHDYTQGRYDEAQNNYQQALGSAEIDNPQLVPYLLNGLGTLLMSRGETREALEQYRRAQDLATQEGNDRERATALAGLGAIDRRQGRPQEALRKLSAALEINRNLSLQVEEGRTLALLGGVYLDLGEGAKAREGFRDAIKVFRAAKDNAWLARSLGVLGNAELSLGRTGEALGTYREMLTVAEAAKLDPQKGAAFHGIGAAQRQSGQLREAIQSLEQALHYRQGKERLGEALTRQELGKAYQAQGDLGRAESSLREALRIADAVGAFLPRAAIHYDLALLARQKGNLEQAVAEIDQAVKILETVRSDLSEDRLRTSFFASRRSYYDLYVDLLMELDARHPGQGYADRALAASERGRARGLLDLLERLELTRGISPQLRQAEAEVAARLSQIQSELVKESLLEKVRPPVLADLKLRLQEAETEQKTLEQRIRAESPVYSQVRYPTLLKGGEIRNLLDPGSALLEYSLGEEASYLFVVTRERGLKAYRLDLSRSEIVAEADKVQQAIKSPDELKYAYRSAAYRLYRTLVAPAEADLTGKRLLIAADGPLNHLPFDALLTRKAQDSLADFYLIQRYTISYIPSASVLSSLSKQTPAGRESSPRFLAFAPSYGGPAGREIRHEARRGASPVASPPALEGAEAEVRTIADRYPGKTKLYLGADASLENAKKGPLVSECVHFACHGTLDEEHPESSGLSLEGGSLTVSDIFNLELNTGLVVLSACETAGKEVNGEGLVGLTRAFLYAGSPSVVVTLWRVSDLKTSDLMVRFYTNLDGSGDKAEALRQAKLGLIGKSGASSHPYYWAPFILVGKPR
jgi:CHAT domain-containing protein/Tfp pilus assembly protein PilF